ncbi:MAG: hypothetical protein ABSH56_13820 [Bryobacteraceae bacterium]|jgi:hypothetical protein
MDIHIPEKESGEGLARHWGLTVQQALYRKTADWYHLKRFPGAPLDADGYAFIYARSFATRDGRHKLLISMCGHEVEVPLGAKNATATVAGQPTQGNPARTQTLHGESSHRPGFGVAMVTSRDV